MALSRQNLPKSTVLGVKVTRDFQNETLIVTCLLRCLLSTEMAADAKIHVGDMILRIGSPDRDAPDLWALQELLLAQMRGLASPIADEEIRTSVYEIAGFGAFLLEE